MTRLRVRKAAVGLTVLGVALGATACDTGAAAPAPRNPAASASSGPASNGNVSGPTGGGTAAVSALARCHTSELKADIQLQKPGSAMVILTNKGSRICTVSGYLGYGGLRADNSALSIPTVRRAFPGASIRSTLKPGRSAFSGLKWTSCDKGQVSCNVLAGVQITPPNETTRFTANVLGLNGQPVQQLTVSPAGFVVGSLQPSNQGVVFP